MNQHREANVGPWGPLLRARAAAKGSTLVLTLASALVAATACQPQPEIVGQAAQALEACLDGEGGCARANPPQASTTGTSSGAGTDGSGGYPKTRSAMGGAGDPSGAGGEGAGVMQGGHGGGHAGGAGGCSGGGRGPAGGSGADGGGGGWVGGGWGGSGWGGAGGWTDGGAGGGTGGAGGSTSGCLVSAVKDAAYWPVPSSDAEAEAEETDVEAQGGFELRIIDESAMIVEPGTGYVAHRIPLDESWASRSLEDISAAVSHPELTPAETPYSFSPDIDTPGSIGARIEDCDGQRTLVVRVERAGYYPVKVVSGSDVKYFAVSTPHGIAGGDCPAPGLRTKSARFRFFAYGDDNVYASLDGTPNAGNMDRMFKNGANELYTPDRRPATEASMNAELDVMLNVNEAFVLHAIGHGWKGLTRPWGGGGGYSTNSAEVQNLLKVPNIARRLKHVYITSCCSGGGAEADNNHFTRNIAAGLATKYHVPHILSLDQQVMMYPSYLHPISDVAVALVDRTTRFVDTFAKMEAAGHVTTHVKEYRSVTDVWDRPIGWPGDGPGQRVTFKTYEALPRYLGVQEGVDSDPGMLRTFHFVADESAQFRLFYSPAPTRPLRSGDTIEMETHFAIPVFAKAGEQVFSAYNSSTGTRYITIYKIRETSPGVFEIAPGTDTLKDQDLVALAGDNRYLSAARPASSPLNATATAINPSVVFRIGFSKELPAGKKVSLKTTSDHYVRAEEGGGPGTKLRVDERAVHELTLVDINGGALKHGDAVRLRTFLEYYASCQGGGDVVSGAAVASTWEVFLIEKVSGADTTAVIGTGDVVAFRTHDGRFYVTGQQAGNRDVVGAATALQAWEKFTIDFRP